MTRYCIFIALLFFSLSSFGQARKLIRKGNKEFDKGNYSQAELSFRQAQAVDTASGDITYNIGNSLYMQKKYDKALGGYQKCLQQSKDPNRIASNLHNAGNALFKMNKYQESVEAYKKSLRFNPSDNQTRYNLALAQQKLKDQQKNNNKNKQNNKNNKDQNKQNKKDNKDNKNNKNDQNKDNKDNKQKQQPQQQPKISKQDAQRMLDALQTGENKAQERVKAQKVRAQSRKPEKNW